jgi:hypothetical protein
MGDRVPPLVQFSQIPLPDSGSGVPILDFAPKGNVKTFEVRSDRAGMRIPAIDLSMLFKCAAENLTQFRRCDRVGEIPDTFIMQIAAETLKLRRQKNGIGAIDLLRRHPAAGACSPHPRVRLLHFIE